MVFGQLIQSEFTRRIQSAYLDSLYAFLDGLVHVAFSDTTALEDQQPAIGRRLGKDVDARHVVSLYIVRPAQSSLLMTCFVDNKQDTRIILTVSNLAHLQSTAIPRMVDQFQSAFRVDMATDVEVSRWRGCLKGQTETDWFDGCSRRLPKSSIN
jgi:exocyst complex component 2